jgi:hypothetical protein
MLAQHSIVLRLSTDRALHCGALLRSPASLQSQRIASGARASSSQPCSGAQRPISQMAAQERAASEHTRKAWDMFRSWGSPKYFVAPMVDQVSPMHKPSALLHTSQALPGR